MDKSNVKPTKKTTIPDTNKDQIRVVSVFVGSKTASEAIHSAAVKKILYDKPNIN